MSAVNIKTEEERKKDKAIEDATARFLAGALAHRNSWKMQIHNYSSSA